MLGDGIMVNFVSYEALKPNVDIDKYPELNTMDEMLYPFMRLSIVIDNSEPKVEPITKVKTQEIKTTSSQFISERDPNEKSRIDRVVDYALSKAKSKSTHWCARYVRQALESQGFNPGNSINGWEYEKAVKNMGWHEVTDGSIKKGDIIVTKKHDGRGHVALATKDGADIFNDRSSSVSDFISRGVPYSRDKVKQVNVYRYQKGGFVEYKPQTTNQLNEIISEPISLNETMPFRHYAIPVENDIAVGVAPVIEPQNYQLSTPIGNIITPTKQYMYNLYSKILLEQGIDTSYAKWLVAHDVLESGHKYEKPSGKFNYGGIKGNGTKVSTHEVINGKRVKVNAGFKDYNSPEEYARDKVRLMKDKYHAFEGDYSTHLKGYATDPNYIKLLRAVHKSLKV